MTVSPFDEPTCLVVTGAGRGFGKAICQAFAPELKPGSIVMLLGRNAGQLQETKTSMIELNSSLEVHIYSNFECNALDTATLELFIAKHAVGEALLDSVQGFIIVHNAGTVGDPSQAFSSVTFQQAVEYMQINFAAMVAANNSIFGKLSHLKNKFIVHISSLAAVSAMKSVGLYCAGKAARNSFMKVFSVENPQVRVLNYAPGPLETEMFNKIKDTSYDPDIKKSFQEMKPLEPLDSANRLVTILKQDKYDSGQHIDFFDPLIE